MKKRVINVPVLPGEPLDSSGRVCIHLVVPDAKGPFVEPHVLHPVIGEDGQPIKQKLQALPTRSRLACDLKRNAHPVVRGNVTFITPRTDDARAVTCPKCKATAKYKEMIAVHKVERDTATSVAQE